MALMKSHYICPYCFNKNKVNNIEFRCINKRCVPEPDNVQALYLGLNSPKLMQKAFKPIKKSLFNMPKGEHCPICREYSTVRICPNCHFRLPNEIDLNKDLIIAVIGAKETGKSHYIAVLINMIRDTICHSYNGALQAGTEETIRRYNNEFYTPLYKNKVTITATKSGIVDHNVRVPLIYLFKLNDNGLLRNNIKTVTLVFFDTAGEDLNDEDTMLTINKYICNSSGLIFLLDPLQLDYIRNALPSNIMLPEKNTESESIITRTTNLIRKANKVKESSKIDIPVAIALTKMDALEPLLDPASSLNYTGKHFEDSAFDLNDFENVNQEMEELLRSWAGNDFAQQVNLNYTNYAYFGITSLGCNPHGTNLITKFRPHRIEDPFLWLLWKNNIIKGKRY